MKNDKSESPFVLLKYSGNWADEIDVAGFRAMTEERWYQMQQRLADPDNYPIEYHVGTNESIEYHDIDDVMQDLTVDHISREEFATLQRLFRKYSTIQFGFFPDI